MGASCRCAAGPGFPLVSFCLRQKGYRFNPLRVLVPKGGAAFFGRFFGQTLVFLFLWAIFMNETKNTYERKL
jgi:hypothetical protein